ncbi:hypothetical protein GCM10028807_30330 [Spirosoma daeguense]
MLTYLRLIMSFFASFKRLPRPVFISIFVALSLFISVITFAQINLTYRLLKGYILNSDATINKGKTTLFIAEQADTFEKNFKLDDATSLQKKRTDGPNFSKETAIAIVLPPTNKPPKIAVSRVFVQDSTLTIRYVRMTDTSLTKNPLPAAIRPTLLFAIPKQTVLKTRLIENGKVVQVVKKIE